MDEVSLSDHLCDQLRRLCGAVGIGPAEPLDLLESLLGPAGPQPLSAPPSWPSNIADDHSPVEFSVAFSPTEPPTVRILGETLGAPPSRLANMLATQRFLDIHAHRAGLSTSRLDSVRDLFATRDPQGVFALWCSLVFRNGRRPEFKVYLNPELRGWTGHRAWSPRRCTDSGWAGPTRRCSTTASGRVSWATGTG